MKILLIVVICICLVEFIISLCLILPPLFGRRRYRNSSEAMDLPGNSEKEPAKIICIDDNEEALKWRLRVIAMATRSLIICSHDFRADNSGKDIMSALLDAACRGVQVRLLADGFWGRFFFRKSHYVQALSRHQNVQIRIYNRVGFTEKSYLGLPGFGKHIKFIRVEN